MLRDSPRSWTPGYPIGKIDPHPRTQMRFPRPVSRRLALRTILAALAAPVLWLINTVARRAGEIPELSEKTLTVPFNNTDGIRFCDDVIIVSRNGDPQVFSSICPHLGCRINRVEGDEIVCPCHGSRYNTRGEVIHGPATHGLRALAFQLDRNAARLRVTLVG